MDDNGWQFEGQENLLDKWPRDSEGNTEEPVFLCNLKSLDYGDEIRINMLESYGIPCLRVYPGDGSFGKLIIGMSGQGTDIYVPKSMYDDAVALCNAEEVE